MNIWIIFLILNLFTLQPVLPASLIEPVKIFDFGWDEKEEQLAQLRKEFESTKESIQTQLKTTQEKIDQQTSTVNQLKGDLAQATGSEKDSLAKLVSLANDLYQIFFNMQQSLKEYLSVFEQHIKLLADFKKNETLKSLILEPRPSYDFETNQAIIKKVFDAQDKIEQLKTQKNDLLNELENSKKKITALTKIHQDKKKELEEYSRLSNRTTATAGTRFKSKIIDLEEQIARYDIQLADLRTNVLNRRILFLNAMIMIENQRLNIFSNNLDRAKLGLRISESEVLAAHQALENKEKEFATAKLPHFEEIKKLSLKKEAIKKEIETLLVKYKIAKSKQEEFNSWIVENPSIEGYTSMCEIGNKMAQLSLIEKKIELHQAQMALQAQQLENERLKYRILETWFKSLQYSAAEMSLIQQELKQYADLQSQISQELAAEQDKKNALNNFLSFQAKALFNIRKLISEIKEEKEGMFKQFPIKFNTCLQYLTEAEKAIGDQIDIGNKCLESINSAINVRENSLRELEIVIAELHTKRWQRSQSAISWTGIKNIIPNIWYFITEVYDLGRLYLSEWTVVNSMYLQELFETPKILFLQIIVLFFLLFCFFFIKNQLPLLFTHLKRILPSPDQTLLYCGLHLCIALLQFIHLHFTTFYWWVVIFSSFYIRQELFIFDLFTQIIFYLISIAYCMYLSHRFCQYIITYNREQEYCFFTPTFERRFYIVFSIFAYSTIFTFLFREAFLFATLYKSDLPNTIMALYSLLIRVLVVFSIGKDEIISLVSRDGVLWQSLEYIIDKYYPIILGVVIFLMILSDPYIGGYGPLISDFLWAIIASLVVARILYEVHLYVKTYSEHIFFVIEEDESKRERFTYARTWYGIAVIIFFIIFLSLGIIVGLKIWSWPVTWDGLLNALDFPLVKTGVENAETVYFTPRKFFLLITFIGCGLLGSVGFNRFVLQRIFSVLPVDSGIQNTVMSIARYILIMLAIYMGFQWAGLSTLLFLIFIVLGSISYISKEPVSDFISYFIVLVQRPVQIGDFIALNDDIRGVVRKITPRSIIVRKNDSYSIIIPNSMLLNSAISNWHYARNFAAIDDLRVSVVYSVDPMHVKKVIQRVLEENNEVLKTPRYIIRLDDFGDHGYVFMIRGFVSNINIIRRPDIASDIRFALVKAFREEKITIAIPIRTVKTVGVEQNTYDITEEEE